MLLPSCVLGCLEALEQAGYPAYVVGGCVRDACLGLQPKDYDLCTAALPEQIQAVFSRSKLVLSGVKHGTVGVVTSGGVVEITTFRREGAYHDNRHPDWVQFVPELTEDLARRDFTVNAMAFSPTRGLADPFGGGQDLQNRCLRAVGDPQTRFQEDALRILRGIRFSVTYGLTPDAATESAMLSQAHRMDSLSRERVFDELCKLLPRMDVDSLLRYAPLLAAVIPELASMIGFDQHSPHHAYDLYTHVAHVVSGVPAELTLRWAALLHDIGKVPTFTRDETGRGHFYGHAPRGAEMADAVLHRLKAPTTLRRSVVELIAAHMTRLTPDKKLLRRQAGKLGWEQLNRLLLLQEADMGSKGTGTAEEQFLFPRIRQALRELQEEDACLRVTDLAINGHDLMALGFRGKAIGTCLDTLLELVQDETLPNTHQSLLTQAQSLLP